ncbi:MAG: alpha/beta fold hydrolase [Candidatus Lokiarchaeota archaeon]|nr:alpha/beta fold hydrolase [Candidatus Lokiarchaeota archaeon]
MSEINHFEDEFEGEKGIKIFYQFWIPERPKAILQIVHGFGEHSGRYLNVINKLLPLNYGVYANDHRGHGKSSGTRTYVDSFDQYVEDVNTLNKIIRNKHPDIPIFMLGHSMGSIIAIHYVKKYQDNLKGFILSGTGAVPSLVKILYNLVKPSFRVLRFLFPKFRIPTNLTIGDFISRDREVVKAYNDNPLVEKTITLNLIYETVDAVANFKKAFSDIKKPLLVQEGSKDTLSAGLRFLKPLLKMKDKTIKTYDGLHHEVYNELKEDRKLVLKDLSEWLEAHL